MSFLAFITLFNVLLDQKFNQRRLGFHVVDSATLFQCRNSQRNSNGNNHQNAEYLETN